MDLPLQILLLVIPSLIVLFVTYFMNKNYVDVMKSFFAEENKLRKEEIKAINQNLTGPLRVQAYERMILFLERISPDGLVLRLHQPELNAGMLHGEIIRAIRAEMDHNLSQQVYLSIGAWQMIRTAKDETLKLINITASSMSSSATGLQLAEAIIENASKLKQLPTEVAIEYLKKEFTQNF